MAYIIAIIPTIVNIHKTLTKRHNEAQGGGAANQLVELARFRNLFLCCTINYSEQ
jgi:hypothetical protein